MLVRVMLGKDSIMRKLNYRLNAALLAAVFTIAGSSVPAVTTLGATSDSAASNSNGSYALLAESSQDTSLTFANVDEKVKNSATYLSDKISFDGIDSASSFNSTSKLFLYTQLAGIEADTESYQSFVSSLLTDENELNLKTSGSFSNDILVSYSYILLSAAADMKNVNEIYNENLLSSFANKVSNAANSEEKASSLKAVNPYNLGIIYAALNSYKSEIPEADSLISAVLGEIKSQSNDNGLNYWGNSADNNANAFTYTYPAIESDSEFASLVDKAIAYDKSLINDDHVIFAWGSENPNSTALALSLLSLAGYEDTENIFKAAEEKFASTTTLGAYTYGGKDNLFATSDFTFAYLFLRSSLTENKLNPYDLSSNVALIYHPVLTTSDSDSSTDTDVNPGADSDGQTLSNSDDDSLAADSLQNSSLEASERLNLSSSSDATVSATSPKTGDSNTLFLIISLSLSAFGLFLANLSKKFSAK